MLYALYDEFLGEVDSSAPLAEEAETEPDADRLRIVTMQSESKE